jgi:hypothetical protein
MRRIVRALLILVPAAGSVGALLAGSLSSGTAIAGHPNPLCTPSVPCPGPNPPSPIIIDVDGSGFHMTSAADGVRFDFYGNHHPIKMSWIAPGSTNAFLVLPQHGQVTNGRELFGNITPQPRSADPNGFLALATYATLARDGQRTDVINSRDPIYRRLRLWQDTSRDGTVVRGKLSTLPQLGIKAIYLNFQTTSTTDRYGNQFLDRARVVSTNPHAGKWAYDVFFRAAATTPRPTAAASRPGTGPRGYLGLLALLPLGALAGLRPAARRRRRPAEVSTSQRRPDRTAAG